MYKFFKNNIRMEKYKKITKSYQLSDYEILTDDGFVDVCNLHETIDYDVWLIETKTGKKLKCADNHIVFDENYDEVFVKNLVVNQNIIVNNSIDQILKIENLGYKEKMFDFELIENSNHRYYTNDILSHNTHLAKMLSKYLFDSEDNLIRVDMSEYMEKFNVSRMVGAAPGYVGYDQGGDLTEKVRNKPYSIVLFDEIEKAHPDVFQILLQILDEGRLTDSSGRLIDFKNTVIIMTSNVGTRQVKEFGSGVGFSTKAKTSAKEEYAKATIDAQLKKTFAPEFLNRIDDIIVFNNLEREDIHKIIDIELVTLNKRLQEMGYKMEITEAAKDFVMEKGWDPDFGARPLKRAIQKYIEDELSTKIIDGSLKKEFIVDKEPDGDKIVVK